MKVEELCNRLMELPLDAEVEIHVTNSYEGGPTTRHDIDDETVKWEDNKVILDVVVI